MKLLFTPNKVILSIEKVEKKSGIRRLIIPIAKERTKLFITKKLNSAKYFLPKVCNNHFND